MTPTGEFSHKVTVYPWPEDGVVVKLTATAAECEALKARFDLADLQSLSASVGIEKKVMELVLAGTIEAVVAQTCVVTLKPVTSSLEVPFERHYRRREVHEKMVAAGEALSADGDDVDVDILDGDEIDLGETVAEEFYLALDPYPRSADADRALEEIGTKADIGLVDKPTNPFEKLRKH
ncbi:MAG: YceD family protein [Geminicoccaceae bacterium]